jgi:predicted membrane channel-forming protein YqfA (hemolysin III family)
MIDPSILTFAIVISFAIVCILSECNHKAKIIKQELLMFILMCWTLVMINLILIDAVDLWTKIFFSMFFFMTFVLASVVIRDKIKQQATVNPINP